MKALASPGGGSDVGSILRSVDDGVLSVGGVDPK